ncbi:MAG: pantoate--beta-alanine ligase [Flavobacteriaceae bacterium]|nr:pantoate--beta-alanine ligase [Flavobacteriaceae bacterium]
MKVFDKLSNFQKFLNKNYTNKTIGCVPTMGALHEGHLSLIIQAINENDIVVVSIFINPTQFNNNTDLLSYPKTLKADLTLLKQVGCDIVLTPSAQEMYPKGQVSETFNFGGLALEMEGKFRPGHFDGVGTVVKRLFEIIKPTKAYFGEKDYQQLCVIKKMVKLFKLPVHIVPCPIFREPNGLAMSSRNERLSAEQRNEASLIYKCLQKTKINFKKQNFKKLNEEVKEVFKSHPFFKLEYFIIADTQSLKTAKKIETNKEYRAFIAVYAGQVRLIDNIAM